VSALVRTFTCGVCGNLLVFENSVCLKCRTRQAFDTVTMRFHPLEASGWALCGNADLIGCNWTARRTGDLCLSCTLTRTRPNDGDDAGMAAFERAEAAKRRLVYQLLDLRIPVVPRLDDPRGLAFDLLSSTYEPVVTGHADGVVTIDLAEGDDPHREAMRVQMGEPYRTLLGHLRHEVGHYYFQVVVAGRCPGAGFSAGDVAARPWLAGADSFDGFRALFGDERADYGRSLERHYSQGPPAAWPRDYVSAYATAHPWEDWAETFAHYLHILDSLQTAAAYGMAVRGPEVPYAELADALVALPHDETRTATRFHEIISTWLPLSYALNAVNRSMGKDDLYPFLLTEPVIGKLDFVHGLLAEGA
jgi:hypothetical protein